MIVELTPEILKLSPVIDEVAKVNAGPLEVMLEIMVVVAPLLPENPSVEVATHVETVPLVCKTSPFDGEEPTWLLLNTEEA